MRAIAIPIAIIAGFITWAASYAWQHRPPHDFASVDALLPTRGAAARTASASTQPDYATRFRDEDDLLTFAMNLAPVARAGDAAAQFTLYRIGERCGEAFWRTFAFHDIKHDRQPTAEETIAQWESRGFERAALERLFQQCEHYGRSDVRETLFQDDWIQQAADAQHPLAQAVLADRISQMIFPDLGAYVPDRELSARASTLARAALRSKEPAVIYQLAQAASLFGRPLESSDEIRLVWIVAACLRGLDCDAGSEAYRRECPVRQSCGSNQTLLDAYRQQYRLSYERFERQARALNALIDAGRVDEVGFEHMPRG